MKTFTGREGKMTNSVLHPKKCVLWVYLWMNPKDTFVETCPLIQGGDVEFEVLLGHSALHE